MPFGLSTPGGQPVWLLGERLPFPAAIPRLCGWHGLRSPLLFQQQQRIPRATCPGVFRISRRVGIDAHRSPPPLSRPQRWAPSAPCQSGEQLTEHAVRQRARSYRERGSEWSASGTPTAALGRIRLTRQVPLAHAGPRMSPDGNSAVRQSCAHAMCRAVRARPSVLGAGAPATRAARAPHPQRHQRQVTQSRRRL
jgi:hypothetical protein